MVPEEGAQAFTDQTGWNVATPEQREHGAKLLESGGAGQTALAAGETAVRTGTFGLAKGLPGWEQRSEVLREEHPYVAMGAQAAGSLAPALVTGGIGGALAEGVGLGRTGLAAVGAVTEGLSGGTAEEIENARVETRDVSAGNILLYGLGGELVGRALPKVLSMGAGRVRRALSAVDEVAGEGLPSALAGAEARSVETEARLARDLPSGPERAAALERTAPQQYEALAIDGAETVEKFRGAAEELAIPEKRVLQRVKELMPDESPAQQNWLTEQKRALSDEYLSPQGPRRVPEAPGVPGAPPAAAVPLDLGVYGKDVRNTIRKGLRDMDKAGGIADQYVAARDMAAQLESIGSRVAKDKGLTEATRDGILESVQARAKALRTGLSDESLFGGAARLESDLARGAEKMRSGLEEIGALSDPGKMRRFLKSDRVDRMAMSKRLDDALDGAEEMLRVHEVHGTLDPKKIAEQRGRIQRLRETRGLADEIQVSQAQAVPSAGPTGGAPRSGLGEAADFIGENVAELFPYGGKIYRLGKRVLAMDRAARQATRQTARKLAGVTGEALGEAAAAAPKSGVRRVVDSVTGAVKEEAKAQSPALRRAMEILENRKARAGESGAVVVEGGASPKIDRLSTKMKERLDKLEELEANVPKGEEDEIGQNLIAERHADRIDRARESLHGSIQKLREEFESQIDDLTHGGHTSPDELRPKARAKYDRLKAGLDEFSGAVEKHSTKRTDEAGDYLDTDAKAAAAEYLSGRKLTDTEAGNVGVGEGIKGILTSPLGLTTGVGALGLAAKPAMSALERFQGDYSGPEESFEAKKKILDAEQVSPEALYETLGASLEDLPKMNPDLYQKIAARTAENVRYIRANLPPGIQTTMMYPNGTPVSQSALREFATIYNTVFDPNSVLEDIDAGTATGLQMKTLRESSPDLYEQLRSDVVEEVGKNFRNVPLSTKLQLDILFEADGMAGPFFSSKAADMIGQSLKDDAARGPSGKEPDVDIDQLSTSAGPSGLSAIQSSVTNKGGA
jgi:hypothetical protein